MNKKRRTAPRHGHGSKAITARDFRWTNIAKYSANGEPVEFMTPGHSEILPEWMPTYYEVATAMLHRLNPHGHKVSDIEIAALANLLHDPNCYYDTAVIQQVLIDRIAPVASTLPPLALAEFEKLRKCVPLRYGDMWLEERQSRCKRPSCPYCRSNKGFMAARDTIWKLSNPIRPLALFDFCVGVAGPTLTLEKAYERLKIVLKTGWKELLLCEDEIVGGVDIFEVSATDYLRSPSGLYVHAHSLIALPYPVETSYIEYVVGKSFGKLQGASVGLSVSPREGGWEYELRNYHYYAYKTRDTMEIMRFYDVDRWAAWAQFTAAGRRVRLQIPRGGFRKGDLHNDHFLPPDPKPPYNHRSTDRRLTIVRNALNPLRSI